MPGFKDMLTPTQIWQVSLMLQHADKLPDLTKSALARTAALPIAPPGPALNTNPAAMQGKKPVKVDGK